MPAYRSGEAPPATIVTVKALALIVPLAAALAQQPPAQHKVELLWSGGAPGAERCGGRRQAQPHCLSGPRKVRHPNRRDRFPRRRIWHAGQGSRRRPDRALAQFPGHPGLRAAIPHRAALPLSGAHPGCATRHSFRARARRRLPDRARPHRHLGILGRRPSGLHHRHALRRRRCECGRPHRPRSVPGRIS